MFTELLLKSIGATLIITGTAVGAGMLAIPLVTASLGVWTASFLLIFCWALMLYTALQFLEVNLAFPRAASFSTMATKTIGPIGAVITWVTICLLLYALCAAYITGGSALLGHLTSVLFPKEFPRGFPHLICVAIFTLFLGGFVFFGTRPVDYLNRVLMFIKLGAFFILAGLTIPHINPNFLAGNPTFKPVLMALPILITSFGFHVVIPSIRLYIGDHPKRLRWIIISGCTLPLIIYLLWVMSTLGVLPNTGPDALSSVVSKGGSVGEMVGLLQNYLHSKQVQFFVNLFTDVAVTTSFLGVALGLFDFMLDGLKVSSKSLAGRLGVWGLVFIIPAGVALFYPQGFVKVLGCAGIFVAILLLILPPWMVYKLRGRGNLLMLLTALLGFGVIVLALLSCL